MSSDQILHLRIRQKGGKEAHRYLNGKDPFYIGRSPKNDLPLFGESYPKKHPLFFKKSGKYFMFLPTFAEGEVKANNSQLRFSDLIEHGLLPKGNGYYSYEVKPGHMGYIFLDSTRIDFVVEEKSAVVKKGVPAMEFDGFSPTKVFMRNLQDDVLFKGMVTILMLLNVVALLAIKDYIPPPKKLLTIQQVADKIVLVTFTEPIEEPPPIETPLEKEEETPEDQPEPTRSPRRQPRETPPPKRNPNPSELGLLSVLSANSDASNGSLMEDLISTGLAVTDANLTSGKMQIGNNPDGDPDAQNLLDDIFSRGIDDIVGSPDGVESVELSQKASVKIETIGGVSGDEEALGSRSESSLYDVLQKNMGRLKFIYNTYLRKLPGFKGLMRVEVTVGSDGKVSSVTLLNSNMGNPEFEQEIMNRIRSFKYPPIASGTLKVIYPLSFFKGN